jgi:pantothenate kinase type III
MGAVNFAIEPKDESVAQQYSDPLMREQQKLKYYTDKDNEENKNKEAKRTIENMTIMEVLQNISLTFNAIIGEILNMEKNNVSVTAYNVLDIFFKDDRPLYIGLVILLTCIGIFIIDVTSPTI